MQVEIKDYGVSLSHSYYGYEIPSADYFHSNLILQISL